VLILALGTPLLMQPRKRKKRVRFLQKPIGIELV
jgi:hypothetical protein